MRISLAELLVIAIVAVAILKPEKIRVIIKNINKALKIVKEENEKINSDVIEPIKESIEPLNEVKDSIEESIQPLNEVKESIKENISINN